MGLGVRRQQFQDAWIIPIDPGLVLKDDEGHVPPADRLAFFVFDESKMRKSKWGFTSSSFWQASGYQAFRSKFGFGVLHGIHFFFRLRLGSILLIYICFEVLHFLPSMQIGKDESEKDLKT